MLQTEYRGHDLDFWWNLQIFNDYSRYWEKEGLTEKGLFRVKQIKAIYS